MEIGNIESFLAYFETIRERTCECFAPCLEKLEWRHADDVFSCGDLARHIAAVERYTFAENALGRPSRYRGCGPELAEGQENVIVFMQRMHRETVEMLQPLTPDQLAGKGVTPQGAPITAWKLLRAMGGA